MPERNCFTEVAEEQWNDWRWQLSRRITSLEELQCYLDLSPEEKKSAETGRTNLKVGITPYYISLLKRHSFFSPLRRSVIPTADESVISPGEESDPLAEELHMAVPGLVHRYPDRVLLLVTRGCSTYCRYCNRSRMVGSNDFGMMNEYHRKKVVEYISSHPEIRDVLISGGDPLIFDSEQLEQFLQDLRAVSHVEIIRIGTKTPAVLPMRITGELTDILRKYHPLWMSLHFIHPDELTPETAEACGRLADAGIPLQSQTVLLKGINDDAETLKKLFTGLVKMRVKPYYLFQCDPVPGTGHFRTAVQTGMDLMDRIRGYISGYAVPYFAVDAPGGGGKIALLNNSIIKRDGGELLVRNYQGKTYRYPDNQNITPLNL